MCTIGAGIQHGRTYLLKNFDYAPTPTGWAFFEGPGIPHFALVDHDQQGVNSGFNASGLALQISRSKCLADVTPEREESRTVHYFPACPECLTVPHLNSPAPETRPQYHTWPTPPVWAPRPGRPGESPAGS